MNNKTVIDSNDRLLYHFFFNYEGDLPIVIVQIFTKTAQLQEAIHIL